MSESGKPDRQRVASRDVRRAPRSINGRQRSSLRVHLTSDERALLEAKANNQGWSLSRTLVHAALHPSSADTIDPATLGEFITDMHNTRRQLTGLANNINQLTRYAHAKAELPKHLEDVLDQIDSRLDDLDYILSGVRL